MNNIDHDHEVELRVLLEENERLSVIDNLERIGAKFLYSQRITDIYYCLNSVASFEQTEMHEVGSFSLRLREKIKGDDRKIELNTKMITTLGDHHGWEEHEVNVDSFEQMDKIVRLLGYKDFFKLAKTRKTFTFKNIEILFEDIDDFGSALELEIITTKERKEAAKDELKAFLCSIGIESHKILPKSITNILMREKSVF